MRHTTKQLPGFAAMLAALTLSACGAAGASTPSPSVNQVAAASRTADSSAPASTAASASAGPSTAAPIKVGVVESFTGPLANNSKDNQDGFNLYLASLNNTVAGRKIQAVFVDDQNQADVALTKVKQLVENDKVQAVLGVQGTPACYAVAQYMQQAKVPTIVSGNCGAQTLTTDPKFKSPYVVRLTQNTVGLFAPNGDWAYKQGYKKAILMTSDYGGGLEAGDAAGAAYVKLGGSIVAEIHPPLGTNDFGPYLAQLNQSADVILAFMPGIDSLRFAQQYATYAGQRKPLVLDMSGQITAGSNLAQAGTADVGDVGEYAYVSSLDTPENKAFVSAWNAKYPGRLISGDAAQGHVAAEVLVASLKKVNGKIEDTQAFLQALYNTNLATVKGPVKLDQDHDIVQNMYFWKVIKQGNGVGQQLIDTDTGVTKTWGWTDPAQLANFKLGSHKGQWVGMTKAKLAAEIAGKSSAAG